MEEKWIEIRCPGDRTHKIHSKEFSCCGNHMGGIPIGEASKTVMHCNFCGFWEVKTTNGEIIDMTKIDTSNGKRIDFTTGIRRVHNG